MKQSNQIAQTMLYNSYVKKQQNHLYILIANNLQQQQELYKWYIKLHVCENRQEQEACGTCPSCLQVNHDNYINSVIIKRAQDKKSIGVDEVNELQAIFTTTAQLEGERFFCIEDADTLTLQAANSVLKFLEEPVGKTVGFLFVKNEQKLLPTIRSRGQIIRLVDEVDASQIAQVAKKFEDPFLQKCVNYLLQIGYDEKAVFKHTENFYEKIVSYCTKVANGSPYIVAQTELESPAQKTKTGVLILNLFMFVIHEQILTQACFVNAPERVAVYMSKYAKEFYIALYHALQKTRFHMSQAMLITSFSLELETSIRK